MPSPTIREDQAEHVLGQLEQRYQAFAKIPRKPYLSAEARADLRAALQTSVAEVQQAIRTIDAQGSISPTMERVKAKLIFWEALAQEDLKLPASG
jgi:hypothetical protein